MKAAVLYELGKPLRIEEVPVPELRDEDVLVKVEATFVAPSMKDIVNPGGFLFVPHYLRFWDRMLLALFQNSVST